MWFKAEKEGIFYGQCSELCGKDHSAMPIEVHVVSDADFKAWAAKAKSAGVDKANKMLARMQSARAKLASADQQVK